MKNYIVQELASQPGIQRDGTPFAAQAHIDGQWTRWYMNKPRKIGGYQMIDVGNSQIIRDIYVLPKPNSVDTYLGRPFSVKYINFDLNGEGGTEIDRTPLTGFAPDINNVWDFDNFTTSTGDISSYIVAQVCPNGDDISNTTPGPIFYGDITKTDALQQIMYNNGSDPATPVLVSGGICFSSPVLVAYGDNGIIQWSPEGEITDWDPDSNLVIANTKILKMYRTRGAAPQMLAWTLTSLVLVTYAPVPTSSSDPTLIPAFTKSTIQDNITVISADCIVEYDQQFFWIGIDQFYYFNGIVNRLENSMSSDWFFFNVNLEQRSKIWGMVIPRFKEIWWFYPKGNATECTDVIIYNVELKVWYDSVLGRAAGFSSGTFPFPMMTDNQLVRTSSASGFIYTYGLWKHEYGVDREVDGKNIQSIDAYFETHIMTLFAGDPNNNRLMRVRRIEPDFKSEGGNSNMTVTVNTRNFAQSQVEAIGPIPFDNTTEKIDTVTCQGRLVSFVFDSNVQGGFFQAGKILLDYEIGDVNP